PQMRSFPLHGLFFVRSTAICEKRMKESRRKLHWCRPVTDSASDGTLSLYQMYCPCSRKIFEIFTFFFLASRFSGADGDRTRNLVNAIHARSQLRHGPEHFPKL